MQNWYPLQQPSEQGLSTNKNSSSALLIGETRFVKDAMEIKRTSAKSLEVRRMDFAFLCEAVPWQAARERG